MDNKVTTARRAVDSLYTNFIMRDLVYIFGGGLILATYHFAAGGTLISSLYLITSNIFPFIIFLAVSYFVGLFAQEAFSITGIVKTEPKIPTAYKDNEIKLLSDIERFYRGGGIKRMERIIFLKHIGATICASSLISLLCVIISMLLSREIKSLPYALLLLTIAVFGFFENRIKLQNQETTYKACSKEFRGE